LNLVLDLPPQAPRRPRGLVAALGRLILWLGGWKMRGAWPNVPRLVVLAAPHSSAWDGLWGLSAKMAMGVEVKFMAKAELFHGLSGWLLGPILRALGAIPIDRSSPAGLVNEVAARFAGADQFWLVLAPEGTRRRVERWKTGFWRIARAANVPVVCAYFHYPERVIGIGECFDLTDDLEADMAKIRTYYRPWIGKNRGTM